jgi:FKBP-type peptidyl-prolyl cis-trans isomerase SlyD
MTIAKDKMVSVTYELKLDGKDGEVFEKAGKDSPLIFLYGSGMMLPAFESGLVDKKINDTFEISIAAVDAYGEVNEEAIVDLPKHIFMVDGKIDEELITPGNSVPMMSTSGQRMEGLVVSVDENTVQMDFNHPLAGEDLFFTGEVLEVRDATPEELSSIYSSGCGCGSGGCGSGSCGDGEGELDGCESGSCSDQKGGGCGCH